MKVTPIHLDILRERIVPLDTPERRQRYVAGDFPRSETVKDLDTRYRWDLLWLSKALPEINGGTSDVWDGYTNAHLDTALRAIVPSLA